MKFNKEHVRQRAAPKPRAADIRKCIERDATEDGISRVVEVLRELRPSLERDWPTHFCAIARLIAVASRIPLPCRRRHTQRRDFMRLTHEEVAAMFGRQHIDDLAPWKWVRWVGRRYRLFSGRPAAGRGACSAIRVYPTLLSRFVLKAAQDELTRPVRAAPRGRPARHGVAQLAQDGAPPQVWRNVRVVAMTPIDREALITRLRRWSSALEALERRPVRCPTERERRRRLQRLCSDASALLSACVSASDGTTVLKNRYEEGFAGRLYASWPSLQTVCRTVRRAALPHGYEFDADCCHWQILAQVSAGFGHRLKSIEEYCASKKAWREALAGSVFGDERRVMPIKSALTALLYGASAATHTPPNVGRDGKRVDRPALRKIFTRGEARRFLDDQRVKDLRRDLATGRETLLGWRRCREITEARSRLPRDCRLTSWKFSKGKLAQGKLVNAAGHELDLVSKDWRGKRPTVKRIQAHILQGYEQAMLLAIARAHGDDLLLLQHDGATASRKLDPDALSQLVASEADLLMTFSEAPR